MKLNKPKNRIIIPVLLGASVLLSGCSTVNKLMDTEDSIDYKTSATKDNRPKLQIPPDLTQVATDDRFVVPQRGAANYSDFATNAQTDSLGTRPTSVLPDRPEMRVQRAGTQRWLTIDASKPDALFPVIREFWQDLGFQIRIERPEAGIMETDWAENRAKIPQDLIRDTIGKYFDSLYSTGELDRFRTRLEVNEQGGTDVFISHQGMVEELTGSDKARTLWTQRPNDPDLEAEFLRRLMVRLGTSMDRAKNAIQNPVVAPSVVQQAANVSGSGQTGSLEIKESFDRAWRRIGLALDRGGFTVEDRNRADGVYYVRYADTELVSPKGDGFLGRIFNFSSKDEAKNRPQYRVHLATTNGVTAIRIQDKDGQLDSSPTAVKILNLIKEQLQ